jgi:transposase
MGEKRRRFSQEFKREAVRLAYAQGRSVSQAAEELDLRPDMLRRWRAEQEGQPCAAAPSADELEVRRLRRDLARVEEEREILKKALAIFSEQRPR